MSDDWEDSADWDYDDDWGDLYDTRYGVDPNDYRSEDDFLSARMSAQKDFESQDKKKEGCYIATCVYGSYSCDEVLVLRRFRDDVLKASLLGRAFIRCYYAVSPKLVFLLGEKKWFRALCKKPLDAWVGHLR